MKRVDARLYYIYQYTLDYGRDPIHTGRIARLRYGHPQGGSGCDSSRRGHPAGKPRVQYLHEFFDTIERLVGIIRHNTRSNGEYRRILETDIQRVRRLHSKHLDCKCKAYQECARA